MLEEQAITEFIDIYQQKFGKKLSTKEATEKAVELLELFKVLFKKEVGLTKPIC